jgi:acetoin utilization protein AcuB
MIARELISDSLPSVKSTDRAGMVLDWMNEFKLNQLPIVDNGAYKGIITETAILDGADLDDPISELRFSGWDSAYVLHENHIYDAIDLMSNFKLEAIPVLDDDHQYLGVITLRDLSRTLGELFAVHEPGGVLVLEIPAYSYVLSEIGRIAESADAKVLSLYLSSLPGSKDLMLTLKLNVEDLTRVIASFERFEYSIVRSYQRVNPMNDYGRNIDTLMRFLDV